MSNAQATNQNEPKKQEQRQPRAIARVMFNTANPHGIKIPWGIDGKGERIVHTLLAGIEGEIKTEIDHLPWMQAFRVKRSRVVRRSGTDGKEVVTLEPMGGAFEFMAHGCVWVPIGE